MTEITPEIRQLLHAHGLTDEEIEQLRASGKLTTSTASISIGGVEMQHGTTEIPPEAIAQLKQFHRFMPATAIDHVERATGEDIDGDGQIGKFTGEPRPEHRPAPSGTSGLATSPAMPTGTGGPFVQQRRSGGGSVIFAIVVLVAAAVAVAIYFLAR